MALRIMGEQNLEGPITMSNNLVVVLPGIMGSKLEVNTSGGTTPLWSEDGYDIVTGLLTRPAEYQYSTPNNVRATSILERVNFKGVPIDNFYSRLLTELRLLNSKGQFDLEEFAYDWRGDICNIARNLGDILVAKHGFTRDAAGHQEQESKKRLTLIAHSMGGLVAAIALVRGYVNPSNVKRLICIGTPFFGAPAAFRGLYSTGYLPGLKWFQTIITPRKNRRAVRDAMMRAMQSFPSAHQPLPPSAQTFVQISGNGHINPLAGNIVPGHMKAAAQQAHLFLSQVETILINNNVDFRLIYGEASRKGFFRALRNAHKDTDYQFDASVGPTLMGGATYVIRRTDRTVGDGTVPVNSAALNNPGDPQTRFGVVGVSHANMCNDKHVVNLVKQWIP